MTTLRWKLLIIAVVAAVCTFLAFTQEINLGLDLRGGIHLVLQVDVEEAVEAEVRDDLDSFRRLLADEGVALVDSETRGLDGFSVTVAPADVDAVIDLADDSFVTYDASRAGDGRVELDLTAQTRDSVEDGAVRQAITTIRNRVDEYGVAEPVVQRQGMSGDRVLVQLPGVADPERIKELLQNTALLELRLVQSGPAESRAALLTPYGGELPDGTEVLEADDGDPALGGGFYLLSAEPAATGRDLKTARLGQDELGLPAVNFTLNADAASRFGEFTGANVGRQLAIVLDDLVMSAPTINERIPGNGQISGQYTLEEAEDLALVLRAGALPASIRYLEERSVGPSLGRESIDQGVYAAIVGMAIVVAFMLVYYKGAGINAVIALALNLIIVMGLMATLGAALTLPGIAGLILLIGMAVDANVIIFERVREELDLGKTVKAAIEAGFSKAFSAIIDANITTLIAAVFLFQFGTGPVRGFAVTLSIGIIASMFTAIFVSRVLFEMWTQWRPRTLSI